MLLSFEKESNQRKLGQISYLLLCSKYETVKYFYGRFKGPSINRGVNDISLIDGYFINP